MINRFYNTLYFKLATGLAIMLLVVGLSYTIFASYMIQQINQQSQQLINHDLAKNLVNDKKIVRHGKIDEKAMKETFMQYMTINPSIEIYYLDLEGKILAYSAEPNKVKRNAVDLEPILKSIKSKTDRFLYGDDPRSHDIKKAFSVTPIPSNENVQGYLYVVLQGEQLTNTLNIQSQNTVVYLGGIVMTGSLIFGLLIGLYLFYRINQRIVTLQSKLANFIEDDFTISHANHFESNLIPGDEINDLERHISRMASHIQQQLSALKQQDKLRREMVANISHDLRTPLASLQGYLETFKLKYNHLSDIEINNYLTITGKQAKGLQKLIDELFELARLDACEQKPHMENFPLLDLAYDVIAKLNIKAEKKQVKLYINSKIENPIVYADIGLIERVLDNLVNNAIYYSHHNSNIKINIAAPEGNILTVEVIDNGCGIPEDQQELIFERFHQAHSPERKDGHAGLGLCIVKKIIELHHQKIWVVSKSKHGTQFNFTLASA